MSKWFVSANFLAFGKSRRNGIWAYRQPEKMYFTSIPVTIQLQASVNLYFLNIFHASQRLWFKVCVLLRGCPRGRIAHLVRTSVCLSVPSVRCSSVCQFSD